MNLHSGNIFAIGHLVNDNLEMPEILIETPSVTIERIVSNGQPTSDGQWYDQEKDEWVMLLKGNAELEFENKNRISLFEGDYLLIPAHLKHRVTYVSKEPNCLWLCFHAKMRMQ